MTTLIVLAKSPVAGRVKTRLCPPLQPEQAAAVAEAALLDTLRVAKSTTVDRRYLVLDGEPGPWHDPASFRLLSQRTGGLDERLVDAFADVFADLGDRNELGHDGTEPCVLIAMDTPHIEEKQLEDALVLLSRNNIGSVFGPAADGGYWLIGLRRPNPAVFREIPMSVPHTGAAQLQRLVDLGLNPVILDEIRDVDEFTDLDAITESFPKLFVSNTWRRIRPTIPNAQTQDRKHP
jgi:uncharacterized protein